MQSGQLVAWESWPGEAGGHPQGLTVLRAQAPTLVCGRGCPCWAAPRTLCPQAVLGGPCCRQRSRGRPAAGSGSPARSSSGRSSDLRAAWRLPAEVAAAPAAASGLWEVGLGAQGGAEPGRLLSDGSAAFEGRRGLGLHVRWLPLGLDCQEGGQVEVQHGHPSTGRGRALAALRAGDPALLIGPCVQTPHARLAKRVATVEAAWQVPGEVVGRVADDAVAPPGPSSCPLLGGLGTFWLQHPGGGEQGSCSHPAASVTAPHGRARHREPTPENKSPGFCRPGRVSGGRWGQQTPGSGHSLGSHGCWLSSILSPCLVPLSGLPAQPPPMPACLSPRALLPAPSALLGGMPSQRVARGGGDPGRPAAPSLGLALLAEPGRVSWWLWAGVGSPFSHKALATGSTTTTITAGDKVPPTQSCQPPPCPDPGRALMLCSPRPLFSPCPPKPAPIMLAHINLASPWVTDACSSAFGSSIASSRKPARTPTD